MYDPVNVVQKISEISSEDVLVRRPNLPLPTLQRSATDPTMFSRLLTISMLIGLALSAVDDEYHQACRAVEAAMSNASDVYYPGEYDREQIFGSKAEAYG